MRTDALGLYDEGFQDEHYGVWLLAYYSPDTYGEYWLQSVKAPVGK